ncbi:MAG TPA: hypothetical protein VLJ41_03955 [Segetibacter sp.]|nr:hypothetical protein [Segetibacter sp.]
MKIKNYNVLAGCAKGDLKLTNYFDGCIARITPTQLLLYSLASSFTP